jgi:hypothetical protein
MKQTNHKKTLVSLFASLIILVSSFCVYADKIPSYKEQSDTILLHTSIASSQLTNTPNAIAVSDSNPFYALIATPLAVHYNEEGEQNVIPLYLKNLDNPSKAVQRAEQQIGIYADYIISDIYSPKECSLSIAETFWEETSAALLIKEDQIGYELGIVATPLASYLNIPIIVTDEIDTEVTEVLNNLGVQTLFLCGDFVELHIRNNKREWDLIEFESVDEITEYCIDLVLLLFDEPVGYITLANPLDVHPPEILNTTTYDYSGTLASGIALPTQTLYAALKGAFGVHEFEIPQDYKYAHVTIDLTNLNSENVDSLGDKITILLVNPDGHRYAFAATQGGLPERNAEGNIIEDRLHFEITIYDEPGTYQLQIFAQWFALKEGSYEGQIMIEKLDSPYVPLMDGLSSIGPYLSAYHKGIVYAKSTFAFAADDNVFYNGTTCPGVSQPGSNPALVVPSNEHTWEIHEELNELLAQISEIPLENFEELRDYYFENPMYIAITADPTMVPMYFYYNPDGTPDNEAAYMLGFSLPSDYMYADIDIDPSDPENNTYTYWPVMENIVGRVTGRDVQDCSALIARTIFYDKIIDDLGQWKDNALVQTGCGLEFQNLPVITRLSHLIYEGRGEPTKFPTGESTFINLKIKEQMEKGYSTVTSTKWLQSQREGFSNDDLKKIKNAGILNKLLFPNKVVQFLSSDTKVTGEKDHLNSNLIFSFAHGSYNLYEHGDVFIDSRGFPFVTAISRIYPQVRSGLSSKGTFDVRAVENMKYGPSVIFIESCITGRTDGFQAENLLSQTYIHAGVNAYIGATRVTADPGYLEPRPLPNGWGIGILGLLKATLDLKLLGKYPDLHFGAVIAEDFILDLIENNSDTGTALRNAKNKYLPKDANSTFLWTPPLSYTTGCNFLDKEIFNSLQTDGFGNDRTRVLDKKYVALHEFTLYGDPAFNPYQSENGE